ncbi:MAG: choice-of-anchor J domain-containing protein [Bacteroidota bacterium]|nr:choice-of-anchor J domain-containing protein [Bacteroidota bacterium]
MKAFNYIQLFLVVLFFIFVSGCEKNKKPWPIFPKEEGSALTDLKPIPFFEGFEYGTSVPEFGIPSGWLEALVAGSKTDRGWGYRSTFGLTGAPGVTDGAMLASAFGGNNGTDNAYLIVGPFNLQDYNLLKFTCDVRLEYTGPGALIFRYSTNYPGSGDPEASGVSWTDITAINSQLPTSAAGWGSINANISIPFNGVFIAMQYVGGTNAQSTRWRIDNFKLEP